MARCGCRNSGCSCIVTGCANGSTTVTGDGSPGNPYVICSEAGATAVTVADSDSIDFQITGTGTPADPYVITGNVLYSADAGNTSGPGSDGGIYSSGGGGVNGCGCRVVEDPATPSVTVTGTGSQADPYVVHGPPDGASTVVTVADTPTIDLTLTGTGTAADPYVITAATVCATNPNPPNGCPTASLSNIYCVDGFLRGDPLGASGQGGFQVMNSPLVPSGSTPGDYYGAVANGSYTNNTCRTQLVTVSLYGGAADIVAQQGNTVINGRHALTVAVDAPAVPPDLNDALSINGQFQISTAIPVFAGATNNIAVNVGSGRRLYNQATVLVPPGSTLNMAAQQGVRIDQGRGAGQVIGGGVTFEAVPA